MANDTSDFQIYFGLVAFPYLAEEAMIEGASYRPNNRSDDIRKSIATLKGYFDKHTPKITAKNEGEDSDSIDAILKILIDSKIAKENEVAQREMK